MPLLSAYVVPLYLLPQGLLASESQRQVDSIERHPIDFSLPSWPVPPHKGVADSADVLVIPESTYNDTQKNFY